MQALKIGHFGLVPRLHKSFKSILNERCQSSAKDRLFSKKISFSFLFEGCLKDTSSCRSNAFRPGEGQFLGLLRRVLVDRDESGNSFALQILAAHDMTWPFWRDHDHINFSRRNDRLEMHSKSVAEQKRFALFHVRSYLTFIDPCAFEVGRSKKDNISFLRRFADRDDLETMLFCDRDGFALFVEANNDRDAAILQVQRMRVTLRSESNYCAYFT